MTCLQRHHEAANAISYSIQQWKAVNRPELPEYRRHVAYFRFRQGQLLWWTDKRERAVDQFREVISEMKSLENARKWQERSTQAVTNSEPIGLRNFNHPWYLRDLTEEAELLIR